MGESPVAVDDKAVESLVSGAFTSFGQDHRGRYPNELWVTHLTGCMRRAFFSIRFNADPVRSGDAILGRILHYVSKEVLDPHLAKLLGDDFVLEWEKDVSYQFETPDGDPWLIKGRADLVVYDPNGNAYEVWEFKFTSHERFNQAIPIYVGQANAYAVMSGAHFARLVLVNRNTFAVRSISMSADESGFKHLVERAQNLVDCLRKDTVPVGPELDWECKFCPFSLICVKAREWLSQSKLGVG